MQILRKKMTSRIVVHWPASLAKKSGADFREEPFMRPDHVLMLTAPSPRDNLIYLWEFIDHLDISDAEPAPWA
jgi:hypothetical protein